MRIFLFCFFFCWLGLFGGIGCKKSESNRAVAARSNATPPAANRMAKLVVPRKPVPVKTVTQPIQNTRAIPAALQGKIAALGNTLRRVQALYKKAYKRGEIINWEYYHKAKKALLRTQQNVQSLKASIRQYNPQMAQTFEQALQGLSYSITHKAHPQTTGRHTYAILQAAFSMDKSQKNALLAAYRATIRRVEQKLVAEKVSGGYRIGLMASSPSQMRRLHGLKGRDQSIVMAPGKKDTAMLRVFLRDAKTGMPLTGTQVSVEILDGKTQKQMSTQLLGLAWSGYPSFVGNVQIPSKDRMLWVQVTVHPFPVTRTEYSRKMLRQRAVVRFQATMKGGRLLFPARKLAQQPAAQGFDLVRAMSLVGGQVNTAGPYRIGLALVPMQNMYTWNNGSLKALPLIRSQGVQIVAFVQDIRSGLLIPNVRIEVFVYWKNHKGNLFRIRKYLKPVYDGFTSYRANLFLKASYVDVRARVDPALLIRMDRKVPATYAAEFKGVQHPALAKRFTRKKAPARRK